MAAKVITLSNGALLFGSDPPTEVPGYVRDKNNRYVFHPDMEPCKFRRKQVFHKPCGKISMCWFCDHFNKEIRPVDCQECDVEPKT